MAASGQRTKINLGAIAVEVNLVKTSSEPAAAKWETKVVSATPEPSLSEQINAEALPSAALSSAVPDAPPAEWDVGPDVGEAFEGAGGSVRPTGVEDPAHPINDDPLGAEPEHRQAEATMEDLGRAIGATEPEAEPEKPKVLRGIYTDDGVFVDLTERLAEIDERVKAGLDGMEIVAAIDASSIGRSRVRGAAFVTPVDAVSRRACAMLFDALAAGRRGLAVRWTKRTNQALGVIVASKADEALVLIEVEFAANMKRAPEKARVAKLTLTLTDDERAAADRFVGALAGRRSDLDGVEDVRRKLHAELLEAAREGTLDDLPAVGPDLSDDDLADLSAAFAEARA